MVCETAAKIAEASLAQPLPRLGVPRPVKSFPFLSVRLLGVIPDTDWSMTIFYRPIHLICHGTLESVICWGLLG